MAKIPTWLLGRHITTITLTPLTVAADGTLTPGTAASLSGYIDGVELTGQKTTENIQSIDNIRANYVVTEIETSVTLTEILKTNDTSGTPTNILASAYYSAFDLALVTLARGGRSYTFYSLMSSYAENINKGKSTGKMDCKMVDPGVANPAYA